MIEFPFDCPILRARLPGVSEERIAQEESVCAKVAELQRELKHAFSPERAEEIWQLLGRPLERKELGWTVQPPTAEGYYWCKRHPCAPAYIEEVRKSDTGFRCLGDDFDLTELGHMWCGPLKAP